MLKIILNACVALTISTSSAYAENNVRWLLQNYDQGTRDERQFLEHVVASVENGISWTNVFLKQRRGAPVYCPPEKISLTGTQIVDILRRAARENKKLNETPYGLGVLLALQDTFPCN